MVTCKVVVTPMAQNSLRTISDRIKEEASAKVAAKVRRAIGETIKSLARLSTYSSCDCPDDGLPKDNPIINSFHDQLLFHALERYSTVQAFGLSAPPKVGRLAEKADGLCLVLPKQDVLSKARQTLIFYEFDILIVGSGTGREHFEDEQVYCKDNENEGDLVQYHT